MSGSSYDNTIQFRVGAVKEAAELLDDINAPPPRRWQFSRYERLYRLFSTELRSEITAILPLTHRYVTLIPHNIIY